MSSDETRTINAPVMGQIAALIEANPQRHDQTTWIDTTGAWEGGWGAEQAGSATAEELRRFITQPLPLAVADAARPICTTTGCVAGLDAILTVPDGTTIMFKSAGYLMTLPGGRDVTVENWAQDNLGLTASQKSWLFDGDRSRGSVLNALRYLPDHPDADSADLDLDCRTEEDAAEHGE